ncbi:four helix bundle protein [Planktothrix mougeotii]|uniref:Four helix bundle protein n=1 Tax=Planktothrix mougeotii LEGE 06226 TaxID=1828728 RepID=A0ABR9U8H1_9CYAN|nr:four helix bundle protein [Planktothrix mougeotii]MBE9142761.1 four helix bundle protein [Planktothrix mougeotii LEGE 06226]
MSDEGLSQKSLVYDKAYKFAIRVVNAYKYLTQNKQEWVLSKQLIRSGTSMGANIAEANGAISPADFSAKMSIAYKECLETKYWLSLLKDTGYLDEQAFNSIYQDADEVGKILFAILKNTRISKNCQPIIDN